MKGRLLYILNILYQNDSCHRSIALMERLKGTKVVAKICFAEINDKAVCLMRRLLIILAFIVGIIPGFFIVFNSVFSDSSGSLYERLFTFLLVIVVYGILGYSFGYNEKSKSWLLWVSLSAPAVIILVLYSFSETTLIGLNTFYACLTLGSSWLGSFLSERLKKQTLH